ncbi:MAG: Gfo/Idh/MocA family protein [Gammaproteobacteria bacterium]
MKNFALIGAAGYIAPRHLQAIRDTGNRLVAALDPNDSVGILDSYFPDASFFTEFERFDRHIDKQRRRGSADRVDFVSICSPNYLHDAHVRFALRSDADAICEKPLVINPWNLDGLAELEADHGRRVYTILQLRLHPSLKALHAKIHANPGKRYRVSLTYITPRGRWYHTSWKGDEARSGGVATNIGVHFYDMLIWLFGSVQSSATGVREATRAAGVLSLQHADIDWYLSVDASDLAKIGKPANKPWRSITIDGDELEFSDVFRDLHTESYAEILAGRGFGVDDVRPSIELLHRVRHDALTPAGMPDHPLVRR